MIKSKIDAREKALELAVRLAASGELPSINCINGVADGFAQYIIGSAELPETEPSAEDLALKTMEAVNQASRMSRESSFHQEIEKLAAALKPKGTAVITSGNFKEDQNYG